MFRIGRFSRMSGLSAETLYHYERMKILLPAHVDGLTGYRYYEAYQLIAVNQILALKDAGCSLLEIADILGKKPTASDLVSFLTMKAKAMEKALKMEALRLQRLQTNIFLIKNGGIPAMNEIAVKCVEPILAASVRETFHKSLFNEKLEDMWKAVNSHIDKMGGNRTVPCMMIYHTGWWNLKDDGLLDVEVVEPIMTEISGNDTVTVRALPKREHMACIVHQGPFSFMAKTTELLFSFIRENGYTVIGPVREIYHKGEWATDDPNEYITELQAPVERA